MNAVRSAFKNPFADKIFDQIIAPKISELKDFDLPAIKKELRPDPAQFINTAFLLGFDEKRTSRGLAILANATNAFEEYVLAKSQVETFLRQTPTSWGYYRANFHFQTCVQCLAIGQEHTFSFRRKQKYYDKNGSERQAKNEALRELYNSSKHHEANLRRNSSKVGILSFYWTHEGVESPGRHLVFQDLALMLIDLCLSAKMISHSGFWRRTGIPKELADLFQQELNISLPTSMISS